MTRPPRLPEIENREGWEVRWQLTLIEPVAEVPAYMTGTETAPKPRLNLVLSCTPTKAADALAAAREFLEQTQAVVPAWRLPSRPRSSVSTTAGPERVRRSPSWPPRTFACGSITCFGSTTAS